ncbi:MAG: sulfotransferase [Planctomycetota bacterium]|nr:sulfotransferase [Planctomycetota bacterium]
MRPVFIGGCSRSGTTLLGSMLGAHSDALCTPESQFKTEAFREHDPLSPNADLAAAFTWLRHHRRFRFWGLPASPADAKLDDGYRGLLEWIVGRYGDSVGKHESTVWVDHTPNNLERGRALLSVFPEARFVHIVRDGRAVAASVLPLDWGPNTIREAATWWASKLAFGLAAESHLASDQIIRVRYEDLLHHPARELERLCEALDMPFEERMIDATGFQAPSYTTTQHELVGQLPNASRADRWRTQLSDRDIEIFEARAQDLLVYLGYEPVVGGTARDATRGELWRFALINLVRKGILNKLRKRRRRKA